MSSERRLPSPTVVKKCLESQGYFVIEDYLSSEECYRLRKLVDEQMENNSEKIQRDYKEGLGGDSRIFGLENIDQGIWKSLYENPYLEVLREYSGNPRLTPGTVLAGKVEPVTGQIVNSGGGWHRDPGTQYGTKVKTIVYLNDVKSENGPFSIIPSSREKDIGQGKVRTDVERVHQGLRMTDEFITELEERGVQELVGKAGTMIIVDVGNIHMGKLIKEGTRYTLTNYYHNNPNTVASHKRLIHRHYISKVV